MQQNENKVEQRSIEGYLSDMAHFLSNPPHIIIAIHGFIAEITRNHKKERDTETADCLHCGSNQAGKLAVHEHHENTGNTLEEVNTVIICLY